MKLQIIYDIDCDGDTCGNCQHLTDRLEHYGWCDLFGKVFDKRHDKCLEMAKPQ